MSVLDEVSFACAEVYRIYVFNWLFVVLRMQLSLNLIHNDCTCERKPHMQSHLFQEPVYKLIWSNCNNCLISFHTSQRGSSYINILICVYRCNERLWYQGIVQTLMSYKLYPGALHIDKDAMLSPLTRSSLTWKYVAKCYIFIMSEYETSKHFLEKTSFE